MACFSDPVTLATLVKPLLARKDAIRLMEILEQHGYETRFVGGSVRDALLRREAGDSDLASTAPAPLAMSILEEHGIRVVPTGLAHGTITAIINAVPYEITTLRQDVKTDGRHAEIAFTTDWESDARRRDFTVNALSVDRHGCLYDYCGGLDDLREKRLRFIDDAAMRMREDYLRLLRLFRFSAVLQWPVTDKVLLALCRDMAPCLRQLSRERIQAELYRLLLAADAVPVTRQMQDYHIWQAFTPRIFPSRLQEVITREQEHRKPDAFRRLVAMLGKEQPDLFEKMIVLTREQKRRLEAIAVYRLQCAEKGRCAFRPFRYHYGPQAAMDCFFLYPTGWSPDEVFGWNPPQFPLRAADLPKLSGAALGQVLKQSENWWIAQDFAPDHAAIVTYARALVV